MAVIKLYNGDCLDVMNVIQDKSVDLILCDLPYGTQKSNGCKWDVVIPFEQLWEQYERVITDVGAIVLFGKEPFSSLLRCSKLELYKYDWIWNKDTKSNFMLADHQPLNNVETISVFSKAYARHIENKPMMTYNPQFTDGERYNIPKETKQTGIFKMNDSKDATYKHKERDTSKRYPFVTLQFNAVKGSDKVHPTQKPVDLLEYLIRTYTNEGDTVLDNTMGSGSTGVACVNTNRNFIGIEKDENYFAIAEKRIGECEKIKPTVSVNLKNSLF